MYKKHIMSFLLMLALITPIANINAQAVSNCGNIGLTRTLKQGSTGTDVMTLQKVLNLNSLTRIAATGAGSPGKETTSFGAATKAAVVKFQTSASLKADGIVGKNTYTALNSLCGQYSSGGPTTVSQAASTTALYSFPRNLQQGSRGTDVLNLQKVLNLSTDTQIAITGAGSPGKETTSFGAATKTAVIKFQKKYNITPAAGYVGPATRTKLTEIGNASLAGAGSSTGGRVEGVSVTQSTDGKIFTISGLGGPRSYGSGGSGGGSSSSSTGGSGNGSTTSGTTTGGGGSGSATTGGGGGGTTTGTTTGDVIVPVNNPPIAVNDAGTTLEDTAISGNVLTNDTDPESNTITVTKFAVNTISYNAGTSATILNVGTLNISSTGEYTFTPELNYNGNIPTVNYTVTDGTNTATGTLTISVSPVNDIPAVATDTKTTNEDTVATGNVLTNDSDVDEDTLVVTQFSVDGTNTNAGTIKTITDVGTLNILSTGAYTFTPALNYNGTVPAISYTVTDGNGGSATGTLNITVTAVNDAPVRVNDTNTILEDNTGTGNVLSNDSDVDGDTLSLTRFTISGTNYNAGVTATINGVGTLQILTTGDYTFVPLANYDGSVPVVTYTLSDSKVTATGTLTITITPVVDVPTNTNPTANLDAKTTNEDTTATGNVLTNDTDAENNTLSLTKFVINGTNYNAGTTATIANVGALQMLATGAYTFIPSANYNGNVSTVTYTVTDGNGGSATANLSITVTAINDSPVGVNDTNTISEDTTATGNVLSNDTDLDGDTLTVSGFTVNATNYTASATARTITNVGSITINTNGTYTFVPMANYSGNVPIIAYTINDGKSGTSGGNLNISVTAVNDAPVANNDTLSVNEDSVNNGNLLTNDTDPDGDTLTVTTFNIAGNNFAAGATIVMANIGTLLTNTNGTYSFTPVANYFGSVPAVTYTISDGKGGSNSGTLTISIVGTNDNPVATNDTATGANTANITGNVLSNDTDLDGDTLTVSGFTVNATNYTASATARTITNVGSITINTNGTYTFTAVTNYTGTVPTITYSISDGKGGSATATLVITVTGVTNANPVAVNDTKSIAQNTVATGNVLSNDTDSNGDTLVVTGFTVNGTNYPVTGSGSSTTVLGNNTIGGTKLFISDNGLATKFVPSVNGRISSIVAYFSRTDTTNIDAAKVAVYADNAGKPGTLIAHSVTSFDPVIAAGSWATFSSLTEDVTGGLNVTANTPVWFAVTTNYATAVRINSGTGSTNQTSESGTDMSDMVFDATWNHAAYKNDQMSIYANITTSGGSTTASTGNSGSITVGANGAYSFTPVNNFTGTVPAITYTVSDGKGGTATGTLNITVTGTQQSGGALKIMPLGDSITDGYNIPGGYRIKLETLLKAANVSYDFVGSGSNGPSGLTDKNHEGHSGYTNSDLGGVVLNGGVISTYNPDVVLLMIGTNDVNRNQSLSGAITDLGYLLDWIKNSSYTTTVLVANITPIFSNSFGSGTTANVNSYNSSVQSLVNSRIANGDKLVFVNMNTVLGQADLADGLHPNQGGYDKMADKWFSSMQAAGFIGGTQQTNTAPVGNNDTATVPLNGSTSGNLLSNDTDANGDTLTITSYSVSSVNYTAGATANLSGVGTFVVNTNGNYSFSAATNYSGTVPTLTYTLSDGKGGTATATLVVTISGTGGGGGSGTWNNSTNSFTYTLPASAVTSAGVYDSNGVLVRTLWSNVTKPAGSNTGTWDKKNDAGTTLTGSGYTIKVLSNNVTYTWEGVVGNTSTNTSGEEVIRALRSPREGIVVGSNLYVTTGFVEGDSSISKISLSNLGERKYVMPTVSRDIDLAVTKAASDGNYMYWAGFDSYSAKSFTFATKVSDDSEVLLSNGSSVSTIYGRTYPKAIDIITGNTAADPTGIAVQKTGNYLYISHGGINQINVFNKSTGASVRTISMTSPQSLAIDGNNNLWIASGTTVKKYQINSDGTLASPSLTISGLSKPLSIAISPDNSTIAVVDAGSSQQVKAFSTSTGNSSWTLGQSGGYATNATVSDDRFMFLDINDSVELGFVAYQSDGSFWVGDPGNARTIQYNSSRSAIGRIEYFPMGYSANADRNNPTRVFSHFLEYAVDYSKPLAGANGSWRLVKNWRGNLSTSNYEMNQTSIFENLITLSNGKTYGTLQKYVNNGERAPEVFELTSSGTLRSTGIVFPAWSSIEIEQDGSVYEFSSGWNSGQGGYLTKRALTGFTNNNPVWGSATNVATIPTITTSDPALGGVKRPVITSSGVAVLFNAGQADNMYHLGGIKLGDNKYAFKTAKSTGRTYTGAYPNDGRYDNGNNCEYCGANVYAVDKNIFWNYNGEFWKNSQVNKWQHVSDNGLLIGIFGVTTPEAQAQYGIHSAPEAAGNAYRGQVVKVGSDYYIYHNDESEHSGVHRWKVSNLNSIAETSIAVN